MIIRYIKNIDVMAWYWYVQLYCIYLNIVFTALYALHNAIALCIACITVWLREICLSVHLSVKRVDCDKKEESSAQICILYERSFMQLCYFSEKKNGWWGDLFYLKFYVKLIPLERKRRLSTDSVSVITPSKKVQLTQIGSLLHAFRWAYKMNIV